MNKKIQSVFLILSGLGVLLSGCKKWEDHNRITDEAMTSNLMERISANPELSRFTDLLSKSGYADTLRSSKVYTVYAPDNAALASLPASLENDAVNLKRFVANHILNQSYYTNQITDVVRVQALIGKYHDLSASAIDGLAITNKDQAAQNGVVHTVSAPLPVLTNTWEFIATDTRMPALQGSLLADVLDTVFRQKTYDLSDERQTYTLFVIKDAAWQAEVEKFTPYFTIPENVDSSALVAGLNVAKDLVLDTLYPNAASLPDTIISKFGVRLGIVKSDIVETIRTSNGVIYVMEKMEATLRNKFRDIIIEGEQFSSVRVDRPENTYVRDKIDSASGGIFRDVLVYNHGVAQYYLRYRLTEIPSITYRAYWMALNDNINGMTAPFSQKIGVDSFNSPTPAYSVVELNRYAEQFAGEFTLTSYRPVFNLYLTAANSTNANANPIVCNYIRLEPVF